MRYFSIFGNPVEHSISPKMHNYLFKKLSIDANYTKTFLDNASKLKSSFLAQNLTGANITVPFKEDAYKICDETMGIAKLTKAVNTIVVQNNKLIGYNTDAPGLIKSTNKLISNATINKILILGAGGTAKAASIAYIQDGYDVTVTNRSKKRLKYFKDLKINVKSHESLDQYEFDLVVNTTSAGLKDEFLPMNEDKLSKILSNSSFAIDCIYNKNTPFLQLASSLNNKTKDGKDMLIYQGIIAFNLFLFQSYDLEMLYSYAFEALE